MERARRRFLSHVRIEGEHWIWVGSVATFKGTHGWFRLGRRTNAVPTHRAAWLLWLGDLPGDDRSVVPCRDRRLCVNPAHLTEADRSEHRASAAALGRRNAPRGERRRGATLTNVQARALVRLSRSGWLQRQLAAKFGVTEAMVGQLLSGRSWSSVTGIPRRARAVALKSESV